MSMERCPIHGPYIADRSTDFGETWCPECGPGLRRRNADGTIGPEHITDTGRELRPRCACGRELDANGEHGGGYGAHCG